MKHRIPAPDMAFYKKAPALCCAFICMLAAHTAAGASIIIHNRDAVVWLHRQTIRGKLDGFFTKELSATCNGQGYKVPVEGDSSFSFVVTLQHGENKIGVHNGNSAATASPATCILTLGYRPEPVVQPYAVYKNNRLTLHSKLLQNPWQGPLRHQWSDDERNPAPSRIHHKNSAVAEVRLPDAKGIYYFHLKVYAGSDTAYFQTYVVKSDSGIRAFNLEKDYAPWIDEAVIYEITPSAFVKANAFEAIGAKLEELQTLGINTVWLQPVYSTHRKGQGYDVTDYFSLRQDFGTEQQLAALVQKAKALGMRVLFDFVPNHSSIHHPYAQDCIRHGTASHYYHFYQRGWDGAAYASLYKKTADGFINYFWDNLVNLDYNNEEVQRWMIEACKYWIKKWDIDGYRFDAVWGVNARAPQFARRLRTELKGLKPDVLLLAEDKGSVPGVYSAGFDAAYDWTPDTGWVSQWSWQYQYDERKSFTVFNHPNVAKRTELLRKALFGPHSAAGPRLRFLENNDLPRFVKDHSLACTRMAAALLFALPGIPMLYNGQEIGHKAHPYTKHAVFESGKSIQALDSSGLFPHYQKLMALRKHHPALQSGVMNEIAVAPAAQVVAFCRKKGAETFIVLWNMDSLPANAVVDFSKTNLPGIKRGAQLEDLLSGNTFRASAHTLELPLEGYGIRWLLVK